MSAPTSTTTPSAGVEALEVLDGPLRTTVLRGGRGPALVFLASEEQTAWTPFLDRLAETFTVHVPQLAHHEESLDELDGLHDLLIYVLDVLDALGLGRAVVVGESFGGMVAAELAAIAPERVSRLVLLAPLGLWRDDEPVPDLYTAPPATLAERLFGDPESDAAREWIASLTDKEGYVNRMRTMRAALHFVFPIPEIGLRRRLHRVSAPTLLVWGSADGVVPVSYAADFAALLRDSSLETIAGGGHLLTLGRAPETAAVVTRFAAVCDPA